MAAIARTETIEVTDHDAPEPDPFTSTTEEIFRSALEDFKSTLTATQLASFPGKGLSHVKCKIMSIQHHQERLKAMMNFSRIQFYLERFAEFDAVCQSTKIGGEESDDLSSFIWGPSTYILQVSQEDHTVLDVVLDAYQRFGKRIPDIQLYSELIKERPSMMKCIAFMYHDLLQFYRKLVKLLTGRSSGWKKTFQANWRDYEQSFETLLKSFDAHGKVLKSLLEAWQKQASNEGNQRLNDHIMRYGVDQQIAQRHAEQYSNDREVYLQNVQVSQDTNQRLNDHLMRSQDNHISVLSHIAQYDQDREALQYGAEASNDINARLNDHVMRSTNNHLELRRHMEQYEQDRLEMLRLAREEERKRKEDKRRSVLDWMSTSGPSQSEYQRKFQTDRSEFPDTGTWILNENKIFNWMNEEIPTNSMVWLNGIKGAGKTILASVIVETCQKIPNFTTSYFYCREDDPNQNNCVSVLRGLLRQMVINNEDLIPSCHEKLVRGEERLVNLSTIKSLLELFCDHDTNQFIIIDGLDECQPAEIKPLVQFWASIVDKCDSYNPGKIRVLLVSQVIAEIRKLACMQSADIFDLHPAQSQRDIHSYVDTQFRKLRREFDLTDDEARVAQEVVCSRARGMFLYAVLTTENLLAQATIRDLKDEIKDDQLPETLGEAYTKIIERLQGTLGPRQWAMAKKIFGWLAGAKRPLLKHELQAALSIQTDNRPGEELIDYHNNRLRKDIREICGSLVHVLEDRIEFIHSTTKSHIIESEHLDEKVIEYDLTLLCLKYLTFPCFYPNITDDNITHYAREGWYSFQDYAISKWKHHLENFIRIALPLFRFDESGRPNAHTTKFSAVLAEFLAFHQESIAAAAQEKPPAGSRRTLLPSTNIRMEPPPSSQQSSSGSSSSSTPVSSQQMHLEQAQSQPPGYQGIDPAQYCLAFADLPFHQDLVALWTHICKHQTSDYKERNKVSLTHLGTLLAKIRTTLEALSTSSRADTHPGKSLRSYYGTHFYKCQRITCDYFHAGFETKSALDNHSNRHDRPFQCPIAHCSLVPFGFSSNKDRDRHIRQYHPDDPDAGPSRFVTVAAASETAGTKKNEAKWPCDLCGKRFTRQAIKKAHVDSHYGTRRHACETCGKMFTRSYDRNRHRKIHTRRAVR